MILMMCDSMVINVITHMTTSAAAVDVICEVSGVNDVVAVNEATEWLT